MKYYAIRNKETKLYLTMNRLTGQYEYTSKEISPYLLKDEGGANIYTEGDNSVEAIPVEIREVIDEPQESVREYFTKALLNNRVYLPVKESKPKWYEINNHLIRFDRIEDVELSSFISIEEDDTKYWRVYVYTGKNRYQTGPLTEEEATAKYNELKKLLEEV